MDADVRTENGLFLRQWLRRFPGNKVSVEQALAAISRLAAELHEVHIERPFHRDIIPSTIVVTENSDGTYSFTVPNLGAVNENHGEAGACRYLAPEQWWGGRQNTATDQYALAVLFVELVTGEVPFASAFATEDESVMRNAVCEHRVKLPEECPKRDVLLRALSKDPRMRYHSCSSFVRALKATTETEERAESEISQHANSHHEFEHRREQRSQRRMPKVKLALVAALITGGIVWGVRSGFFERLGMNDLRQSEYEKQLIALQKHQAQEAAAQAQAVSVKLAGIRAEIVRQESIAAQALTNLQVFLEAGGAGVLSVRRETLGMARKKADEELAALERETAADRALEQALMALKMRTVPYGNVSRDIPERSEVAQAYKVLAEEAVKLNNFTGTFTEKHPSVTAQKRIVEDALRRFYASVDGALKMVRATAGAKEKRLGDLREKAATALREFEAVSRECQVARLKQDELERTRARESDRLSELRLREFNIQFGADNSSTNSP